MSVQEAIDTGLRKLGFKEIRENQRKVVEGYVSGRDVLMVAPTGSGKSLTFHIAPFVLDVYQHGERDVIETVYLVIFPLVSLMKDQVSSLRKKGVKAVVLGPESSETEIKEASEGKFNLVFTSPEALFGSQRSTIVALKSKIKAVFIGEVHCVAKWGHGSGLEDAFRSDYARLAEIRSILKSDTPFIGLTATATEEVQKTIIKDLAMKDCVQLITVPNKENIRFSVSSVDIDDLAKSFDWLINELKSKQRNTQKVLIFCRKRAHVKDLYETFHEALGVNSYCPSTSGEPRDDRTRLFAMYHKKTHPVVKEVVEREFCKVNGSVRVVFCTIAFGMGVNVEGAYLALHLGPSSCLDDYLQEVGRIGRTSEKQSQAVLLTFSGYTRGKNISSEMKEYVKNRDVCRRSLLMQPFLTSRENRHEEASLEPHLCCDICAKKCRCLCSCKSKCTCDIVCNSETFFSPVEAISEKEGVEMTFPESGRAHQSLSLPNKESQEMKNLFREKLFQYRAQLALEIPERKLLIGIDIATGFSSSLVENIVSNVSNIDSLSSMKNMFSFFNEDHAIQAWQILNEVKASTPPSADGEEIPPSCSYESVFDESTQSQLSSDEDTDDSDIYIRRRICHITYSDSDDSE